MAFNGVRSSRIGAGDDGYSPAHDAISNPGMKRVSMASWILRCRDCGEVFTHCQIGQALADYFIPAPTERFGA